MDYELKDQTRQIVSELKNINNHLKALAEAVLKSTEPAQAKVIPETKLDETEKQEKHPTPNQNCCMCTFYDAIDFSCNLPEWANYASCPRNKLRME